MDRRRFLAWAAAGTVGPTAGCTDGRPFGRGTPTSGAAYNGTGVKEGARVELPVPKGMLRRGAPKDGIPAITEPAFGPDWGDIDADPLRGDDRVVGVARGGEARVYPLRVLNWHEIANDTFDGAVMEPYCPLCGSVIAADRLVDGEPTIFGVSGFLWNRDLVMYDSLTDSLWSQIAATANRGEQTGKELTLLPSSLTTWASWTDDHPDTKVLLPPPRSKTVKGAVSRDYNRNPYGGYEETKAEGLGITADGVSKA